MTTETTALTVQARAAVALGSTKAETELLALVDKSKSITVITNPDGRTECHSAAMLAKSARVGIEKAGKAARDDATQFSRAVIAEEKRLVDLIAPEESRLITLRDDWDSAIAREKAAKAEAERLRIAEIHRRIANIRAIPLLAAGSASAAVLDDLEKLKALEIDDSFKEFFGDAAEARAESIEKLTSLYDARLRAETEAIRIKEEQDAQFARMKAEREELARLRAEQVQRDAEDKARRDEEARAMQKQRDEIAAAQKRIDDETARLAAEKARAEQQERDRIAKEAAEKLEADRKADPEKNTPPPAARLPEAEIAPPPVRQAEDAHPVAQIVTHRDELYALLPDMTDDEIKLVLHYCERLILERQAAA